MAAQDGVRRRTANVGFDAVLGAVPLAGDVFDLIFRLSSRNLKIGRRYLNRYHP